MYKKLNSLLRTKDFLFLGVGNSDRGDDGIGNYIVSRLKTSRKIDCGPVPENFTSKIRDFKPKTIVILDAIDFQEEPGKAVLVEASSVFATAISTHGLSLSLFCKLFPESEVYLLGIQPKTFECMSEAVKNSADALLIHLNDILK